MATLTSLPGAAALPTLDGSSNTIVAVEDALVRRGLHAKMFGRDSGPVMVGRYEVNARIGAGAMGRVYAARDRELDRNVAIKLLTTASAGARDRLKREAQALAALEHPNVVTVFECGQVGTDSFIAMELVEGRTMAAWLCERPPAEEIAHVLWQVARGIAAAHSVGILHRDIKPDNVMIGPGLAAKILDFGLSKVEPDPNRQVERVAALTADGSILGTPKYMPPEALLGALATPRSDVFSLCITICEAYGGEPFPTDAATMSDLVEQLRATPQLPHGLPPALRQIVVRGLAFDPRRRPSVAELVDALRENAVPPSRSLAASTALALLVGFGLGHRYAGAQRRANALLAAWGAVLLSTGVLALVGLPWGYGLLAAIGLSVADAVGAARVVLRHNTRVHRANARVGFPRRHARVLDWMGSAAAWSLFLLMVVSLVVGVVRPFQFDFSVGPVHGSRK